MRMSVKLKLALSFGLILVLSAVAAFIGVNSLNQLDQTAQDLVSGPAKRQSIVQDMNTTFVAVVKAEKNMILSTTDESIDHYDKEILLLRDQVRSLRTEYRTLASEEGRRRLDAFGGEWDRYVALQDKVRELMHENSNSRARDMSMKMSVPVFAPVIEGLRALSQRFDGVPVERAKASYLIERLVARAMEAGKEQKNALLARDAGDMTHYEQTSAEALADVTRLREQVRPMLHEDERRQFDQLFLQFDRWHKIHNDLLTLNRENTNARAFEMSAIQGRQVLDKAQVVLDSLLELNQSQMKDAAAAAAETAAGVRTLLTVVVLVSLLIGVVAAAWMATSISRGLGQSVFLANAVASGDLNQRISVSSNDEIRDLVDALETMREKLREVVAEAGSAAENVAAGSQELSASSEQLSQGAT
ncbi:HAMP domain-containing methyl-accepting chemotaxis protein, partial [Magnetospirillum aberrantis]